uniref:Unclassified n=1 Tax=Fusarium clavum TaxID=2594811 RepID=W1I9U2_9HYPO|nr:unclassified [Fusarium clavum]CEF82629.1 unclassified [Fusarium clavum]
MICCLGKSGWGARLQTSPLLKYRQQATFSAHLTAYLTALPRFHQ